MSRLDDDRRDDARAEEARARKMAQRQERLDVQAVFGERAGRRLLAAFLHDAGIDRSAFATDPLVMAQAAAWQDAARWWLDRIREHCPEKEAQLRKESREAQPDAAQDDDA